MMSETKAKASDISPEEVGIPATHPKIEVLREMLKAGVHFGHRASRWSPKMAPYIHGTKGTVHIFNLEKTLEKLEAAEDFMHELAKAGRTVLFVGTKPSARVILRDAAIRCAMPHVYTRWLGGTLTNFKSLSERLKYFLDLEAKKAAGELAKYPKKEQILFDRQLGELEEKFGGIKKLSKIPDALFIVDSGEEETALREARRLRIPVVAIVDTDSDPTLVTHPIPANDDAPSSIAYVMERVIGAFEKGKAAKDSPENVPRDAQD